MSDPIARAEVAVTGFGFYSDDEVFKMSCCKITSTMSLDSLGQPLSGGLCDPKMGPIDPSTICPTCQSNYIKCPGHCGCIELLVPVYRPLLFPSLFQLLRAKCAFCHKLKVSTSRCRLILTQLKLLEMGDILAAKKLDELSFPTQIFNDANNENSNENRLKDMEVRLKSHEEMYKIFAKKANRLNKPLDHALKAEQRAIIEAFQRQSCGIMKCENCSAAAIAYRKDGHSKIFQRQLSRKGRKLNAKHCRLKTGLQALSELSTPERVGYEDADSDEDDGSNDEDDARPAGDMYLAPLEVEAQMKLLWMHDGELLDFIWSRAVDFGQLPLQPDPERYKLFFQKFVLVPPTRFRPASKVGGLEAQHPQSVHLTRILEASDKVKMIRRESISRDSSTSRDSSMFLPHDDEEVIPVESTKTIPSRLIAAWIELQNAVNCYIDSSKDPNPLASSVVSGIRQLLERKEGLFRMHMMGKRVNFCCRSVISPDPYIGTNEIGLPVLFAKTLHYPEPVNDFNIKRMRQLVENGPDVYPGANKIDCGDGNVLSLEKMSKPDRLARAKLLNPKSGAKVYRHLVDGDILLVNRQPTLHKPGIMAHKARVLRHVKEKTLRLSYANCNSYNADFDGDEMNCHFLQNELARAEAYNICNTDNQYIVPTSGNPLRGLIQDHVASGVKLTCRNIFLAKGEFMQLVFIALSGLPGVEVVGPSEKIELPQPSVLKPKQLWTGKQVISALLRHLIRPPLPLLNLDGKARTPPTAFGIEQEEHIVTFRNGELLCGVLDKAAMGNSSLGVVHAVYEIYGSVFAGQLLNAFGRLFTFYLQDAGQSCGIEALTLNQEAEHERTKLLSKVQDDALKGFVAFSRGDSVLDSLSNSSPPLKEILNGEKSVAGMFSTDRKNAKIRLDSAMQSVINKSASDVIKACLPGGLERPFQKNDFSMMVLTGAKGSAVNQSQISCFLGQQALEGMRVPVMISGKTLPSFRPYDASPRAGGFVQDRFLTGVKPQEYYFHCMAGREGLVDTAVKTSRSGYLQRCLVKHLEDLKVNYDMTVRDSNSNIIQFLYGEDGLDCIQSNLLRGDNNNMLFLARNNQALVAKYALTEDYFDGTNGMNFEKASEAHKNIRIAKKVLARSGSAPSIGNSNCSQYVVGDIVQCRRKIRDELPWSRGNIEHVWYTAEIINIRSKAKKGEKLSRAKSDSAFSYDLKYSDNEAVSTKVPLKIKVESKLSLTERPSFVYLIKSGVPDPVMSTLKFGTDVGACSEKIQTSYLNYCQSNPDRAISDATTESTVEADSLELLLWIKFMRSMACPGEAVGCIAAQSIGEPSTQMTLNTFHLAGHGGANVTLGIPRLREILMTASRLPKTPCMILPLLASCNQSTAKSLARSLSRVSLHDLLSHQGGIEVREAFTQSGVGWNRLYQIKLSFEHILKIQKAFDISFETIVKTVQTKFMLKLTTLLKLEIRKFKTGKADDGKQDSVDQFISKVKPSKKSTDADDDVVDDGGSNIANRRRVSAEDEALGDEEEDDEESDDIEQGTLKLAGKSEVAGYEDDEKEIGEAGQDDIEADYNDVNEKPKIANKSLDDLMDDTDDEGGDAADSDSEYGERSITNGAGSSSTKKTDVFNKTPTINAKCSSSTIASQPSATLHTNDSSTSYNKDESWVKTQVSYPATSRRFLMVQLVQRACEMTTIQDTPSIANAYAVTCDVKGIGECQAVQTEGVNLEAIWSLSNSSIQLNDIKCNDIWQVLNVYGVEAARLNIVNEITTVFGSYGIDVNPRHLSLIADFMTRTGCYIPMNRMGMMHSTSPFLQMSFESTSTFLTKASQEGSVDSQQSPSARIVLGSVPRVGTGCFELMVPLNK